eukprot:CAMPEP_0201629886 /NCGR_PEP_ID=MMETSP0493-20130528/4395_1 /ASSEMBLY_ACC=CAM_ASM_000838 /TAXON_ID=420259 /ORGANISM="Thalassiosira gravida, Strain GMp14c1" /LENGTH=215 /DNA_ID=CAMNT_0048100955 /DNA_START=58 /DNA_END=705 /DNA_ORIENTATION=+
MSDNDEVLLIAPAGQSVTIKNVNASSKGNATISYSALTIKSRDELRLQSVGSRPNVEASSFEETPVMAIKSSFEVAAVKTFNMCWLRYPSSQHWRKIPPTAFTFSGEPFIRFNRTCIMPVYVMLSAFNPTEGRELKAEAAICKAFLFLSSLSVVSLAHVFISMLNEIRLGSYPVVSIFSNKARTSVTLSGSSLFEMISAKSLKITLEGLDLFSPL